MGDRKFTVLELHFGDVQIGPRSARDRGEADEESGDELEVGGGRRVPVGKKTVVAALLGVGVLGGVAVAAKALTGGNGEESALDEASVGEQQELGSTEFED
jgi:hypothetical protein